jgi:biotin transport system ATP-binding protein
VVLVTHHLEQLDGFDRVLVVDGGRVVADGRPAHALAAYSALVG